MSAPSASGDWCIAMMLLSTMTNAPACGSLSQELYRHQIPTSWAIWLMARMSHTCMRGLVGDSRKTNLVTPGRMAARTALHTTRESSQRAETMRVLYVGGVHVAHVHAGIGHHRG